MSALSDVSLRVYQRAGLEVVGPLLPDAIQPASIDLTLGPVLTIPARQHQAARLKPGHVELPDKFVHVNISEQPHPLAPGESLLATTAESVAIPPELVGLLVGRSTVARLFVSVEAAGLLDPGYVGKPTLEISNHGPYTVYLDAGIQIAQLLLLRLTTPAESLYDGRYQNDLFPTPARAPKAVS